MSLGEQIKGVIKERILLLVLLQQVRQGGLKKRDLRLRVFHICYPLLESRSRRAEYLFEAQHSIRDFMHAQLEQMVESLWSQFYANGAGIRCGRSNGRWVRLDAYQEDVVFFRVKALSMNSGA